jgi:hypothetical protein
MKLHPHCAMPRPGDHGQTGSLAVEVALTLPILVLLFCGIIEIANILRIQTTMQSAVTKIAHQAIMGYTDQAQARADMQNQGLIPMVQQSDENTAPLLTLSPEETVTCKETPCEPLEVKLTYTYSAMTPPMKPFFDQIQLTASIKKMSENW